MLNSICLLSYCIKHSGGYFRISARYKRLTESMSVNKNWIMFTNSKLSNLIFARTILIRALIQLQRTTIELVRALTELMCALIQLKCTWIE